MPIEINWQLLMPELVIALTLLIVLVFDLFDSISKAVLGWITIVGAGIALWVSHPDAPSWHNRHPIQ